MKNLIFVFTLIFSFSIQSQEDWNGSELFIRVYNLQGEKIAKGKIKSFSDTILQLSRKSKIVNISYDEIGSIKTKRSIGNNILIGASIGGSSLAILGVSVGETGSYVSGGSGSNAAIGLFAGGFFGGIIGGTTAFFKKSDTFIINGDKLEFNQFLENVKNLKL